MLLNAGASATNINILNGDQSVFTRDISIGGNAYTEALQKELNLPFDLADQLKRGMSVDGVTFEDARPVLRAVSENVMLEIQKTFDFFKATAASDRIDRIMLSGGASRAEGFTEMLTRAVRRAGRSARSLQARRVRREEVPGGVGRRRGADGGGRGRPRAAPGGRPMIRINLLAVDRERTKRGALIPAAHRVTIAASLILIGTVLRRRLVVLVAAPGLDPGRRGDREGRSARCSSCGRCSRRCRSSRRSKAQLQQRVTLIEQLRRGQSGPVHMLDEISKAVPERLWLTDMTQKGDDIVLAGMTTSLDRPVGFRRQPGSERLVQEADRHRRQPGDVGRQERGHLQVLGQGGVQQPRSAAAATAGGDAARDAKQTRSG